MKTPQFRVFSLLLTVGLILTACNVPTASMPPPTTERGFSEEEVAATVAASLLTAQPTATTGAPAAAPPEAGPCEPTVTANVNANVRGGPDTAYNVVAALLQNESAKVAGKNADASWWYIQKAEAPGGYGWIAASVVTSACIPADLVLVPSPPLPPTEVAQVPEDEGEDDEGGQVFQINPGIFQLLKPDLTIIQFSISPPTPKMFQNTTATIVVKNQGSIDAGTYNVRWYGLSTFTNPSCSWNTSTPAGETDQLVCVFQFQSWYPINKTSLAIADYLEAINESNESNNQATISPFGVNQ